MAGDLVELLLAVDAHAGSEMVEKVRPSRVGEVFAELVVEADMVGECGGFAVDDIGGSVGGDGGVAFWSSSVWALDVSARYRWSMTDYVWCGLEAKRNLETSGVLTLGVAWL